MKINYLLMGLGLGAFLATSCNNAPKNADQEEAQEESAPAAEAETYVANLSPLNTNVTGSETSGKATFEIKDGNMHVTIDVQGAPAGIEHWQHFHGFENGDPADVPTAAQDANKDGIIDVTETGAVSGTTMVPFNALPAKMDVGADTYPVADDSGAYHYEATIPLAALDSAFAKAFNGDELNLDTRVLYIHGVPTDAKLPKTVASIADIPASITLPIAAGKITKVQ